MAINSDRSKRFDSYHPEKNPTVIDHGSPLGLWEWELGAGTEIFACIVKVCLGVGEKVPES